MQSKLEMGCEPKLWSDLTKVQQFQHKLKAKADPVYFWKTECMGNCPTIWASQQKLLREFMSLDENGRRKFKELLFSSGMRSGKSFMGALIVLTELAFCMFMDSPQKFYQLLPKEQILFLATASTEKQCHRTIFAKIVAAVECSPFLLQDYDKINYTTGRIEFPNKLVVLGLGSNLSANVGLTVKVFVAEEINFTGDETYKVSPKVLYNKLSKSTSTFKPFGEDIKVAISSRADGGDFLSKRIRKAKEQNVITTMSLQKTTLEMNPNIKMEDLKDEFLMDEDGSINDYGIGIRRSGMSYIKQRTLDKFRKWNLDNIFEGEPEYGQNGGFIPHLNISKLKYDKNATEYGIFTDPASTSDGFGFCLAHLCVDNLIVVDGITVIIPEDGEEVDSKMIQMFVEKIMNVVPVEVYTFDVYLFNELRSNIADYGIANHKCMLNLPHWESLKERIDTRMINGPMMEYLEKELMELRIKNKKVDHPTGGSKDMADALCQVVAYWDNPEEKEIDENQVLLVGGY